MRLVPAPDPPPALSPPDATGDPGGEELIVNLAELEHVARFYRRSWPIPALATVREWALIVRALDAIPADDDQAPVTTAESVKGLADCVSQGAPGGHAVLLSFQLLGQESDAEEASR